MKKYIKKLALALAVAMTVSVIPSYAQQDGIICKNPTADGNKRTVEVESAQVLTTDNVIVKSVETGEVLVIDSVEAKGNAYEIAFTENDENIGGEYEVSIKDTDTKTLYSSPVEKGASVLLEENFDYTTMGNFYNPQDPRYQPTWDTSIWEFSYKNWWNSFAYKTGSGAKIIDGALHVQAQWGSRDARFFNGLKHSFAKIDDGKFEISFDMAAFNEKVDASRTDAYDQVSGFMLFVNGNQEYDLIFVNEENIYYYDNNERKLLEGYASSNQTGNFDAYKAVLDFDEEKILYYFEDEQVAEGVMPDGMKNGVSSITFAQHRDAEIPKLSDQPQIGICHSLVDNVVLAVDGVYDNAGVLSVRYNSPISTQYALQEIPANITEAVITFANPMDVIEKGKISIKKENGEEISAMGELSADGLSYNLIITEPLTEGEEYTLFIDKTIRNTNGLNMQRDYNGKICASKAVEIFNVNRFALDRDKVSVDIFNSLKKEGKIYVSYAIYSDGVMRDVKIKEIDLIEDASSNDFIQTELYFVAEPKDTIKAFLWEDNESMRSIKNSLVSYGTDSTVKEDEHQEIIAQTGDEEITICGKTEADKTVSVDVYAPGKTYTDLPEDGATGIKSILVYRDETITDENGNYCFVFNANDEMKNTIKSGLYNVRISVDGEVTEEKVVFSEKTENEEAISKLLLAVKNKDYNSDSEESFKSVFNTYLYELGIDDTYFEVLDKESIMHSMYESLLADMVEAADRKKIADYFEASVLIEKLNKGMCENIFDSLELFDIEDSRLNDFYKEAYVTEEFEKVVTKSISKVNLTSKIDFYEKFTESFVCKAASTTEGVGYVEDILKEFEYEIGINTSGVSQKVYSKLANETYSSYEELKDEFNKIKKTYTSSGSQGGSGGGAGGSKNNKGNGTTYSGMITTPEIEEMHYNVFDDIENVSWAKESIVKLAEKGILRGKQEGMFFPNDNITREEFVKIIVMGFEISAESEECTFEDTDKNAWYYPYVATAFNKGVVKGISDTEFGIGNKITRQDLAVIAYSAAIEQGKKFKEISDGFEFADNDQISDYAKEAVYALYASGIINGMDGANFAPDAYATRAQAAKILYQIIED